MKTTLLFSTLFTIASGWSQHPIPHFHNEGNQPTYEVGITATPLNHSASGANQNYDFSSLVAVGTTGSNCRAATAEEITTFPGTTLVQDNNTVTLTDELDIKIYFKNESGAVSITGFNSNGMILNYLTNNGYIGTFPLSYGHSQSDDIAGTFQAMDYSGTFNGTMNSTVDAYGTLTTSIGNIPEGTQITRLKILQNISLNYIIPNVGTVTQTSYLYYASHMPNYPIFRHTETRSIIPALEMDETFGTIEAFSSELLNQEEWTQLEMALFPNPTQNHLSVSGADSNSILEIYDLNGRSVLRANGNTVNTQNLQSGVYLLDIRSGSNRTTKKFVKE